MAYLTLEGKLFKVGAKETKRLLKAKIKGTSAIPRPDDEIGPVIDLAAITPAEAEKAYLAIEMED